MAADSKGISTEVRVGLLFFVGLVLLAGFSFLATDVGTLFQAAGTDYEVSFPSVSGLKIGDPVSYAGMAVGRVKDMKIDSGSGRVRVIMEIDPEFADQVVIHTDDTIRITQDLFGGSRVSIDTTGPDSPPIEPGTVVEGKRTGDLSAAMQSVTDVLDETKGLPSDLKDLVASFKANQDRLLKSISEMVEENRKSLKGLIKNLETVSGRLKDGTGSVGKLLTDETAYNKLLTLEDRLTELSTEMRDLVRENRPGVKKIVDNFETMTDKMASGEGSIGEFIMKDDLKEEASLALRKLAIASDSISEFAEGVNQLEVYLGAETWTVQETDVTRGRVFLKLVPPDRTLYVVGGNFYYNDENREKGIDGLEMDLQIGFRYMEDHVILRAGLIEGWGGLGLDLNLPDDRMRFTIEGRFEDEEVEIAEPFMLRSTLSYQILPRVPNLRLHIGAENILDEPSFAFGITITYMDKYAKLLTAGL